MPNSLQQKNKGFTLVETLVAISIFVVSLLALMVVLGSSVSSTSYAKNKDTVRISRRKASSTCETCVIPILYILLPLLMGLTKLKQSWPRVHKVMNVVLTIHLAKLTLILFLMFL